MAGKASAILVPPGGGMDGYDDASTDSTINDVDSSELSESEEEEEEEHSRAQGQEGHLQPLHEVWRQQLQEDSAQHEDDEQARERPHYAVSSKATPAHCH